MIPTHCSSHFQLTCCVVMHAKLQYVKVTTVPFWPDVHIMHHTQKKNLFFFLFTLNQKKIYQPSRVSFFQKLWTSGRNDTVLYHLIQFDRGCDLWPAWRNYEFNRSSCDLWPTKNFDRNLSQKSKFFEIFFFVHWMVSSGGPVTWDTCDISTNWEGLWPVTCWIELNGTVYRKHTWLMWASATHGMNESFSLVM